MHKYQHLFNLFHKNHKTRIRKKKKKKKKNRKKKKKKRNMNHAQAQGLSFDKNLSKVDFPPSLKTQDIAKGD